MPPPKTSRLFAHYASAVLDGEAGRALVTLRLAEEGDTDDLRRLVGELGEDALRESLARYGTRQLSRRSRAFWRQVLDVRLPDPAGPAGELWPL